MKSQFWILLSLLGTSIAYPDQRKTHDKDVDSPWKPNLGRQERGTYCKQDGEFGCWLGRSCCEDLKCSLNRCVEVVNPVGSRT
jgi:hypothetical protein